MVGSTSFVHSWKSYSATQKFADMNASAWIDWSISSTCSKPRVCIRAARHISHQVCSCPPFVGTSFMTNWSERLWPWWMWTKDRLASFMPAKRSWDERFWGDGLWQGWISMDFRKLDFLDLRLIQFVLCLRTFQLVESYFSPCNHPVQPLGAGKHLF